MWNSNADATTVVITTTAATTITTTTTFISTLCVRANKRTNIFLPLLSKTREVLSLLRSYRPNFIFIEQYPVLLCSLTIFYQNWNTNWRRSIIDILISIEITLRSLRCASCKNENFAHRTLTKNSIFVGVNQQVRLSK